MQYRLRTLLIVLALGPPIAIPITGCQKRPAALPPEILEKRKLPDEIKDILNHADRLEVFSIGVPRSDAPALTSDKFQTCTLLGKAVIDDKIEREELLAALYKGIAESTGPAICFEPGFGLRATANGETVELLICFECLQIEITLRGQTRLVYTSDSPLEAFNVALRRAGAPLP